MDRLGAGLFRSINDGLDVEIAVARPRRAEQHGGVRHRDMHRAGVGFGIDGDGAQAHGARGSDDAAGDLAAVGDQERAEAPVHLALHRITS